MNLLYNSGIMSLDGIVTLIRSNSAAINGMDAYLTQISAGIGEIATGVNDLKTNYAAIALGDQSI